MAVPTLATTLQVKYSHNNNRHSECAQFSSEDSRVTSGNETRTTNVYIVY
jgi:hypothetical protein